MIWSSVAGLLSAEELVNYTLRIKPIFGERCFACHGALKQTSGLRLDSGPFILAGSDSGAVVVPEKPAESLLISMVADNADSIIPREGEGTSLKSEEIELLKRWIAEGAQFPEEDQPERDPRSYWSYQPIVRPQVPQLQNPVLANNPIDAFLAAQHEENHLIAVKTAEAHFAAPCLSRPHRYASDQRRASGVSRESIRRRLRSSYGQTFSESTLRRALGTALDGHLAIQ